MRRLNGVATYDPPVAAPERRPQTGLPDWRLIAASIIDAGAMAFTLLVVITSTVAIGLPISALDRSAGGPIFLVTFVLTACYFVFFGGIIGRTAGEYVTGVQTSPEPTRLDLRTVALRTRQSIFRDSYFIELLGEWIGRRTVGGWHWLIAHAQK